MADKPRASARPTDRFWVSVPGREGTTELTGAELSAKKKRGDMPAGTLVARFGEKEWVPLDKWKEVDEATPLDESELRERPSFETPPPSLSAQGVDLMELPPEIAPTIAGSVEAPKEEKKPEQAARPTRPSRVPQINRTMVIALGTALVAIVLGASVMWTWLRYGYSRGAVLEHVPSDCARLDYVDLAAIDASAPVRAIAERREKAIVDWAEDLDDEDAFRKSTDDDAKGRASVLRVLKKLGLRPYGDVKEIAECELREGGESSQLVVVGGSFRGRDLLNAIKEALVRRDRKAREDKLIIDELDGRPMLKLEGSEQVVLMATSQVALIGKKKIVGRYVSAKPVGRAYGIREGEVIVRRTDAGEKKGTSDERYVIKGDKLIVTRLWTLGETANDDVNAAKERFKNTAQRLRKMDGLDVLADAYDNADIHAEGVDAKSVITWTMTDLGKAAKSIVDADRREMKGVVEALRYAPGSEFLHQMVIPGVDYFTLRISPW